MPTRLSFLNLLLTLLLLAGCQKPDDIVRYSVARPPQSRTAADTADDSADEWIPGQILGAIVPQGERTWFFKLIGPLDEVKPQLEPFLAFMKSVRFTKKGPEWSLPEGWKQLPGSDRRFATVKIPAGEKSLELTVIPLQTTQEEFDEYLVSNVNRWREQLRLGPISKAELAEKTVKIELEDTPAWLFNGEGQIRKGGTGMLPFAGKRSPRGESASSAAADGALPFTCDVPDSWRPAQANAMQLAAYEVGAGKRKVTISVSTAGGNLAGNINRWREQVHLPPLEGADLGKSLQEITVDGQTGVFVDLVGPEDDPKREALLGVVVAAQGGQWFIKLKGDVELAAQEKARFEEFVHSIRFRGGK
jgi:hypothetical protein